MYRFVIKENYVKMYSFINNREPSMNDIAKEIPMNYPHVITVLKQFQEEGVIEPIFYNEEAEHKSKPGSPYIVKFTMKGKVQNQLLQLLNKVHHNIDIPKIAKLLEEVKND